MQISEEKRELISRLLGVMRAVGVQKSMTVDEYRDLENEYGKECAEVLKKVDEFRKTVNIDDLKIKISNMSREDKEKIFLETYPDYYKDKYGLNDYDADKDIFGLNNHKTINEELPRSGDIHDAELPVVSTSIVKPRSFENAKKHLQSFATKTASDFGIAQVPYSGGLFGLGDHKVTGYELNKVTSQVENYLSKINSVNIDLVKEFGQVYTALESLDKEYIPAIMGAVKGAECASNQAKNAANHAKVAQEDIKKTIAEQRKIIKVLENHKEKLDKISHLECIDDIWNTSQELENELASFKENFNSAQNKLSKLEVSIKSLQNFCNQILDQEHLEEIDEMWSRVEKFDEQISELNSSYARTQMELAACNQSIDGILIYVNTLKEYEHLEEIDTIWMNVQNGQDAINHIHEWQKESEIKLTLQGERITDLLDFQKCLERQEHLTDIDALWLESINLKNKIDNNEIEISATINDLEERQSEGKKFEEKLNSQSHLYEIDKIYANGEKIAERTQELELENRKLKENILKLNSSFENEYNVQQSQIVQLKQSIKNAYITAAVAIGLGLLEVVLNIIGVL